MQLNVWVAILALRSFMSFPFLSVTFPFLVPLFFRIGLTLSPKETTDFFYDVTESALKERLKEKEVWLQSRGAVLHVIMNELAGSLGTSKG